jgi:hypothetical protein
MTLEYFQLQRKSRQIQLTAEQLKTIGDSLAGGGKSLLIFGVGNDTSLWLGANVGGTTVFLEDDAGWIERVRSDCPGAAIVHVTYGTCIGQWMRFLFSPEALEMRLPDEVARVKWNVILVDAPAGHAPHCPGRMKSIYTAARLAGGGTCVFVHDCERFVETVYTWRFLCGRGRFWRVGNLHCYQVVDSASVARRFLAMCRYLPVLNPLLWSNLLKRVFRRFGRGR